MNAHGTILRPVITEEPTNLMDNKKYTFDVLLTAIKIQVRNAVEEISGIRVKSINIMNVCGKDRRVGRYTGRTVRRRKAIVTLTNDSNDIKTLAEEDDK